LSTSPGNPGRRDDEPTASVKEANSVLSDQALKLAAALKG